MRKKIALERSPSPLDKESFFMGLIKLIYHKKKFLYTDSTSDGLNYWRERVVFAVLATAAGLSLLVLTPAVYLALTKKLWIMLIVDCSAFLILVSVLFSRHFDYRTQTKLLLLVTFIIGGVVTWQAGFLSGGPIWLFTFAVLAGVFLGLKAGLAATMLNAVALILLAWLADDGHSAEGEFLNSLSRSITAWGNFIFLNVIVVVSVATLVNALQTLNQKTAAATAALREEKEALLKTSEALTNEIEERKRTALELEQARDAAEIANRAKSEFLANMSHELRTPLNHIMGFTELVVDRNFGDLNEVQTEYLNDTLKSSRHLLSLINDMLDLSKVEAGKLELEVGEIQLQMLLDSSLNIVKEKAMKHRIQLLSDIKDIPETIQADERKLKQIFYNLLSNAVKFTPDGGSVTISARFLSFRDGRYFDRDGEPLELPVDGNDLVGKGKGFIHISIQDTGIGIRGEDLKRIFNPFEQVDGSASRQYAGTGLGLSLTKSLVELHGGKIWAESEGEGKGSKFILLMPV
jgi:signal transduction histidine kinase